MTVLTDGDAGLRTIHRQVAPHAEHVLDWFHIAMKFPNLQQLAKGVSAVTDHGIRSHALAELNRAKWRFWNGLFEHGLMGLVHLRQWAAAQCFDHISVLKKLQHALLDVIRYLELNADSMPNYGRRYRAGQRISTGFVESAVNEIVAKRMVKKQQMRWNRRTVQSFLEVRIHVLNGTLEDAFRHWHQGFRPIKHLLSYLPQLERPTTLHALIRYLLSVERFYLLIENDNRTEGGGQPQRHPEHQPEGNPAGELADSRTGQGS